MITRVGRAGGGARWRVPPKHNTEPGDNLCEGRWQADLVPAVFLASSSPPDRYSDRAISVEESTLQNYLQVCTDTHVEG